MKKDVSVEFDVEDAIHVLREEGRVPVEPFFDEKTLFNSEKFINALDRLSGYIVLVGGKQYDANKFHGGRRDTSCFKTVVTFDGIWISSNLKLKGERKENYKELLKISGEIASYLSEVQNGANIISHPNTSFDKKIYLLDDRLSFDIGHPPSSHWEYEVRFKENGIGVRSNKEPWVTNSGEVLNLVQCIENCFSDKDFKFHGRMNMGLQYFSRSKKEEKLIGGLDMKIDTSKREDFGKIIRAPVFDCYISLSGDANEQKGVIGA